jgi:hypothetical protein
LVSANQRLGYTAQEIVFNFLPYKDITGIVSGDFILKNNRVTGADGACYRTWGEECDSSESCSTTSIPSQKSSGNTCHSSLRGIEAISVVNYGIASEFEHCSKFSGFFIYKCFQYGLAVFIQSKHIIFEDIIISDTINGMYANSYGPDVTIHQESLKKNSFYNL